MSNIENFFKNIKLDSVDMLKSGLYVFLILYASMARPQLPEFMNTLFQNNLFRILVFFLIVYLSDKENDIVMSILVAIAFFVTMNFLTERQITEKFVQTFKKAENENK